MINAGTDRQLFIDDATVDRSATDALFKRYTPIRREIVFTFDKPWETGFIGYHNIVTCPDGRYLMYYKASGIGTEPSGNTRNLRHVCVLESNDGIHWTRPELDINPVYKGSNIISTSFDYDNFFAFYDTNPNCRDDERFKALIGEWNNGLYVALSADGIHFRFHRYTVTCDPSERVERGLLMLKSETNCHFDTLNTVYYKDGLYHVYARGLHKGDDFDPQIVDDNDPYVIRDVRHSVSKDFYNWSTPEVIRFDDSFDYQLYTNGITPYYRCNDLLTAIPTRYVMRNMDDFSHLPLYEERKTRSRGSSLTDTTFMFSRDGLRFTRTNEPFISPDGQHDGNWRYGDCYVCPDMIETPADIKGKDNVLSLFCGEMIDGVCQLLRYTMRIDGFACYYSTLQRTQLALKPFVLDGTELEINAKTSALGGIVITLSDGEATFTSREIFGDSICRRVEFDGDISLLKGKTVNMTVSLSEAEIYSFKFS